MKRILISALLVLAIGLTALPLTSAQETPTVRVAVIPVLDTLPLFIADEAGYFEGAGVNVEFIPVSSPVERDQLIQAGEADAMITDIPGVGFFNETETRVQIVYTTRVPQEDGPIFRILAAPGSDLTTPADLAGEPIGVSEATIIEYLTFRLLEAEGVEDIQTQAIPQIPVRFQLLMEGELPAATLPDPLAQAAIGGGATLIVDDTALAENQFSQSVLVFTAGYIDDNPDAVAGFISAWDQAVADLNADPEAYRELFIERTTVPEPVQATYEIPAFPRGVITTEAVWDDYMAWMLGQEIIDEPPAYGDSVNDAFMPDVPEADDDDETEEAGEEEAGEEEADD